MARKTKTERGQLCDRCKVEVATLGCPHIVTEDGQVIVAHDQYLRLLQKVADLKDLREEQRRIDDLIDVNRTMAYDEAYGKSRAHMMGQLADDEFIETVARLWYEFNEHGRVWADAPPEMRRQWVNHTRPRLRVLASLLRGVETPD